MKWKLLAGRSLMTAAAQPLRLRRSETKKESFTGNIPEGFFKESLQVNYCQCVKTSELNFDFVSVLITAAPSECQ
ncbi:hypothetical protein D9C73_026623 [Collichthys lucidus]|uniref:Uncharacterized protein n=1 Tax=Collichthys lucidus TaxID=240159 RepID=A0A4U5VRV0_COLLU|nr:hypothetical protein D9C73_026623 [Collichthys lucidus]